MSPTGNAETELVGADPFTEPPTMRAARFHGARDIRIEEVPAPRAADLAPRDVLVRIRACGICGSDLHEYTDGPIHAPTSPHPMTGASIPVILGHEFSGEVVAIGSAVTSVGIGDRIAAMPQIYCGTCSQCKAGRQQTCQNLAAVGYSGPWGGLAEYGAFREDQVFPIAAHMTFTQGALVEPTAVAVHSVATAPLRPGDAVLVTGGGPIGQLAALAAVAFGAGSVVLSEPKPGRRGRARTLGLTRVVDPLVDDLSSIADEITQGRGFDVCIEASGSQPAIDACFDSVALGGVVLQTALSTRPVQLDVGHKLTVRDVTYRGVYCYPVTSWPRIIGLIGSGSLPADVIVTKTIPLEQLADAFEALLDPAGDALKIVVSV
jgi:(R,R)-butanediol dehydrogenase / meso-butanediol dehydrogenase / diacetyl reductase